jgi:hypothetical protein
MVEEHQETECSKATSLKESKFPDPTRTKSVIQDWENILDYSVNYIK